jgi:hypothetical protein
LLRAWLEQRGVPYVLAIKRNDTLPTAAGRQRADALIAALAPQAWQKIPAGAWISAPRPATCCSARRAAWANAASPSSRSAGKP